MITVCNVTKHFGRVSAVDGASFSVEQGQAMALWGSNGAGKTTLIRCLLGIIRFRGHIEIAGHNVKKASKATRQSIGYVPQELAFHDDMRLGAAMRFFGRLRGVSGSVAIDRLAQVGLQGHEHKRVRDLSGGMKQRLALAIALLSDPPIIFLDEPTSNLDASGRRDVFEMLIELKGAGKTLLFASHRPDEVIALADRVLLMDKGCVLSDTTPQTLWPKEKGVQTVRLHLQADLSERAASLLRKAGHAVHLNGHGLCVAVSRDQKAAPIHVLARADIDVRDFEMMDDIDFDRSSS